MFSKTLRPGGRESFLRKDGEYSGIYFYHGTQRTGFDRRAVVEGMVCWKTEQGENEDGS